MSSKPASTVSGQADYRERPISIDNERGKTVRERGGGEDGEGRVGRRDIFKA